MGMRPDPDILSSQSARNGWWRLSGQSGKERENLCSRLSYGKQGGRRKATAPATTTAIPKGHRGTLAKNGGKNLKKPHKPPAPQEERSAIGPRECHSRAPSLEKAHRGRAELPHAEGLRGGQANRQPSPHTPAHHHTQGAAKTVSPKSRPLSPAAYSSLQDGGRLPGRRSRCRCHGQASGLSRPLPEGARPRPASLQ